MTTLSSNRNSYIPYTYIVLIILIFLMGCSKKLEKTTITLECNGKTTMTNFHHKEGKGQSQSWDVNEIIELTNILSDFDKNENYWSLIKRTGIFNTKEGNYPDYPNKPYWNYLLTVDDRNISLNGKSGNDFDSSKPDDDGMNQKKEYIWNESINRITGVWSYDFMSKTFWKNGNWVSTEIVTKGYCSKAVPKF